MPLGVPQYIMPNARVRSMIGRLLTAQEWQDLYKARDFAAMLAILRETTYGPQLAEFEAVCPPCELLEARLGSNMALRFARVIDLTPEPARSLVIVLKQLFEVDNLKTLLRGLVAHESPEQIKRFLFPIGRAASFNVDYLLQAKDVADLVLRLQGTVYGQALRQALARYEHEQSLFPLEVSLDLDYYRRVWQAAQSLQGNDRKWADLLIGSWMDAINILWALRYRHYYHLSMVEIINYTLPYGHRSSDTVIRNIAEGGNVQRALEDVWGRDAPQVDTLAPSWLPKLEASLYRHLSKLARGALVGYPFHLGVVLAYLILKRFEVQDLRVLAEAKSKSLSPDVYLPFMIHEMSQG
jgi:V/A-type H+-transporting ATPase subunit C